MRTTSSFGSGWKRCGAGAFALLVAATLAAACSDNPGKGSDAGADGPQGPDGAPDVVADASSALPDAGAPDVAADMFVADAPADVAADRTTLDAALEAETSTPAEAGPEASTGDGGPMACGSRCAAGQKSCGDVCVSVDDPRFGCSPAACDACPTPRGDFLTLGCSAGACVVASCPAYLGDCDRDPSNGCETNLGTGTNCGACGNVCTSGLCKAGQCVATCDAPLTSCGAGMCADTTSDLSSCGTCFASCPAAGSTPTCTNGQCAAGPAPACPNAGPGGFAGGCGPSCTTCGLGIQPGVLSQCTAGQCVTGCAPGYTTCGGACVDLSSDPANCGACAAACASGQACESGACVQQTAIQVVAGLTAPDDLVGDGANLYFTDPGTNTVWQASKTTFATTALGTNQAKPMRIAVDATNVYWTSNQSGAIVTAPIGGGAAPRVLYSAPQAGAIAVDDDFVYWSDFATPTGFEIRKAPKVPADGGTSTLLTSGIVVSGVLAADEFLIDANKLYVVTASTGTNHEVFDVDKTTGAVHTYDSTTFTLRGLAIDGDSVFWMKIPAQGTAPPIQFRVAPKGGTFNGLFTFDPRFGNAATYMALAGCNLYWTDHSTGIWAMVATPSGAAPHRLSSAGVQTNHIAVDDKYVYWTDTTWIGRVSQ